MKGSSNLVEGVVERVDESGGVDVRSNSGQVFRNARILNRQSSRRLRPGSECLLLVEGSKFFVLGEIDRELVDETPPGEINLIDSDALGQGAGIRVGANTGVIIDAGGICVTEWTAALSKRTDYLERAEVCMPSYHSVVDHDGTSATTSITIRDRPELDAADRELEYSEIPAVDAGQALRVEVGAGADFVTIDLRNNGVQGLLMRFNTNGSFELSVPNKLSIAHNTELVVDFDGTVRVNASGKVVLDAPDVCVGAEAGSEPLSIARVVEASLNALATALSTHQHQYLVPLIPGGLVPTVPGVPTQVVSTPMPSTATSRVKGV